MKKYFEYELKKSLFLIGCLTIIASAWYLVTLIDAESVLSLASLGIISSIGGLLAFGLPFYVFSYKMKKRSVDLFYALPLSHTKILVVKFLVGLIIVFIPYTVAYWLGLLVIAPRAGGLNLNIVYFIPQFFASIIPIYLIYAISSFCYTRANRRRDGQALAVLWFFAVALVLLILMRLTAGAPIDDEVPEPISLARIYYILPNFFFPSSPLNHVTTVFQAMILGTYNPGYETIVLVNMIVGYVFVTLWGAGSTVGIILLEKKSKAENIEQITESWFGYKTVIPVYTSCLVSLCVGIPYVSFILIILVLIGMYILSASYRRTVKIGWQQFAVLGGSVIAGIILYYLSVL